MGQIVRADLKNDRHPPSYHPLCDSYVCATHPPCILYLYYTNKHKDFPVVLSVVATREYALLEFDTMVVQLCALPHPKETMGTSLC